MAYYKESSPFNPIFYRNKANDPNLFNVFWRDKAACDIEHGRGNPTRVVPFTEFADFRTKQVRPDKKYSTQSIKNEPGDALFEGTKALFQAMCEPRNYDAMGRCWIIHFSPADTTINFPSGRITIYDCNKIDDETAKITAFGSLGCTLDADIYFKLAGRVSNRIFWDAKQLRDFPIVINSQYGNIIDYLAGVMPELKEDWEAISSHLAAEFFAKVLAETQEGMSEEEILQSIAVGVLGIAHDGMTTSGRSVNYGDTQCPTKSESLKTISGKSESKSCPEIKCGACGWKPNDSELSRIMAKELTECPVCARKKAVPDVIKDGVIHEVKPPGYTRNPEIRKYLTHKDNREQNRREKGDWIINLFLPWMTEQPEEMALH